LVLTNIVEQVFDSLMWTNVSGGIVEDISPLESWKHRSTTEIEADLAYLEIDRQAILSAFSEYLANESIATKQADWLFLNVLSYAEYIATVAEIRRKILGVENYVKSLFPPKSEHCTDISELTKHKWYFPLALSVVVISWFIHPAVSTALAIYILYVNHKKRKAAEEVNYLLSNMLSTYSSFNTVDLSWENVTETLKKSRDKGAIWDSSLFALAERRYSHGHA